MTTQSKPENFQRHSRAHRLHLHSRVLLKPLGYNLLTMAHPVTPAPPTASPTAVCAATITRFSPLSVAVKSSTLNDLRWQCTVGWLDIDIYITGYMRIYYSVYAGGNIYAYITGCIRCRVRVNCSLVLTCSIGIRCSQ